VGTALPGDLAVWDGHVAMIVNGIMVEAGNLEGFFSGQLQRPLQPLPTAAEATRVGGG